MTRSKILATSALALAFATPALAATIDTDGLTLAEHNVYLFMNGKMMEVKTNDAGHAMAMKNFKPLKNGTMVYVSGGKFYIGDDHKMANGKMLHTEFYGKDLSAGGW